MIFRVSMRPSRPATGTKLRGLYWDREDQIGRGIELAGEQIHGELSLRLATIHPRGESSCFHPLTGGADTSAVGSLKKINAPEAAGQIGVGLAAFRGQRFKDRERVIRG